MIELNHDQPLSPVARRLVSACNDLGFRLLRELLKAGGDQNLIVSPFGLSLALAVLCNGAGGNTRQALRDVLGARDLDDADLNAGYLSLRRILKDHSADFLLNVASAIWIQEGLKFDASFVNTVRQYYEAEMASLDFGNPTTINTINQWAQQQSAGKINSIVESDDISSATDLILATIAYFKGSWANPFDRALTHEAPFHLANGQSKTVPMMRQEGSFKFYETPQFQAVRLPYDNERLSMYLFLPTQVSSPAALLKSTDNEVFKGWATSMKKKRLSLYLPRFELHFEAEIKRYLTAMGLGVLFGVQADFSPMGLGGQFVEKLKLKAMIEVNEEGTEAAAANTAILGRGLAPSLSIVFDRPFLWAIVDDVSQLHIFAGQVMKP